MHTGGGGGRRRLPPYVVCVASGKGGVGKSTVAVNVALALSQGRFGRKDEEGEKDRGYRVGIADVDVYGPSLPTMLNVGGVEKPGIDAETRLLEPVVNYGVMTSSVGFLVEKASQPAVWRGPLVMSMVKQLVWGVDWGDTEVLVIDTPPGTGDALLTLTQDVPLSGVVIVSTPQDVAVVDAIKGANMFRKMAVPIFGLVENMAYVACDACGDRSYVFGSGALDKLNAGLTGPPLASLGQIPLASPVAAGADAGVPLVLADPAHPASLAYASIAASIHDQLQRQPVPRRPT